jgi:hypothetical protein
MRIRVDAESAKLVAATCKCVAVDVKEQSMFCATAYLHDLAKLVNLNWLAQII